MAATHENLSHGTKSTEFIAPPSFAFDLMRMAVLSLAVKNAGVRSLINPRQSSAITYNASPLNAAPERSSAFAAGPVPDPILPECPVTLAGGDEPHEDHLTDLVQPRFTALYFAEGPTLPAHLRGLAATLARREIPSKLVTVTRHLGGGGSVPHGCDHTGRLFEMYGAHLARCTWCARTATSSPAGARPMSPRRSPPSNTHCTPEPAGEHHDPCYPKDHRDDGRRSRCRLHEPVKDHDPAG